MVFFDTIDWIDHAGLCVVKACASMGFSGVILNETVHPPTSSSKSNFKEIKSSIVKHQVLLQKPAKPNVNSKPFEFLGFSTFPLGQNFSSNEMMQLTRATVQLNQPSQLPFLDKLAMSCIYDIIAVTPEDNATWLALVAQGNFDIISLDLTSSRLPFTLRRHHLMQLIRRNVFFEVRFNEALLNSQFRRNLFTNIQQIIRFVPHDHIIISSGSRDVFNLRTPQDIIYLAQLMGITQFSKRVISENVYASINKAAVRRTAGGAVGYIADPCNETS